MPLSSLIPSSNNKTISDNFQFIFSRKFCILFSFIFQQLKNRKNVCAFWIFSSATTLMKKMRKFDDLKKLIRDRHVNEMKGKIELSYHPNSENPSSSEEKLLFNINWWLLKGKMVIIVLFFNFSFQAMIDEKYWKMMFNFK